MKEYTINSSLLDPRWKQTVVHEVIFSTDQTATITDLAVSAAAGDAESTEDDEEEFEKVPLSGEDEIGRKQRPRSTQSFFVHSTHSPPISREKTVMFGGHEHLHESVVFAANVGWVTMRRRRTWRRREKVRRRVRETNFT